jgi:hypothetical protein
LALRAGEQLCSLTNVTLCLSSNVPESDLQQLLTAYAVHGVTQWQSVDQKTQLKVRAILELPIAENDWAVRAAVGRLFGPKATVPEKIELLPMPLRAGGDIKYAFFLPQARKVATGFLSDPFAFELVLLMSVDTEKPEVLAFRYEPADDNGSGDDSHAYGHVQMCTKLFRKTLPTKAPGWLPTSYPAHPLGTSDSLLLFLSMMTALHGYRGKHGADNMFATLLGDKLKLVGSLRTALERHLVR